MGILWYKCDDCGGHFEAKYNPPKKMGGNIYCKTCGHKKVCVTCRSEA